MDRFRSNYCNNVLHCKKFYHYFIFCVIYQNYIFCQRQIQATESIISYKISSCDIGSIFINRAARSRLPSVDRSRRSLFPVGTCTSCDIYHGAKLRQHPLGWFAFHQDYQQDSFPLQKAKLILNTRLNKLRYFWLCDFK